MKRMFMAAVLVAFVGSAWGQVRTARGNGEPRVGPGPRAAYNSTAKDTTPLNCERYRSHPHPGMVGYCQGIENMLLRDEARRAGRPAPSDSIIDLPGLGSSEAKALGYACVGGQAFKRLSNGWEQVHALDGGWQRCRGG